MNKTDRNALGFEVNVQEAIATLRRLGYKVETAEVHGHYRVAGSAYETWNQRGIQINVFPHKDR